ncbi:MAG: sensor histidine kinase [bacterium]|nr:sensor histidine kinase [bacterium]
MRSVVLRLLISVVFTWVLLPNKASYGQNQNVADSLKQVLLRNPELNDSIKYELLYHIVDNEGKPDVKLEYSLSLLDITKKLGHQRKIALALDYLHLVYRKLGDLDEANHYYYGALKIFEDIGRKDDLAASYAQEASLLMVEGQYLESATEYLKSLHAYISIPDTLMANVIRVNLGETYRLYEKYDSASLHLKQALNDNYQENKIVEGYGAGNLGMVYNALGQLDSAKLFLETSIEILKPLGDVYSVAVYEFELGKVLIAKNNYKEGQKKMLRAYEAAINEGLKEQIRDFSKYLSEYYATREDFRMALGYQKQYELYKDSLINIDNVRQVEQLRGQHEVQQRDAEITFLNELNKSQKNTLLAIGSGSVILLVLLGLLYRNNQQKKKANATLAKREKEKGLLLQELNHRTRNNLNMISNLLNLQSNELGDQPAAEAVRQGRYRVDSLALIHKKLYQEDYSSIHMEQYLKELLEHLNDSFDPDVNIDVSITVGQMKVDQAIPVALIVNELVTNALKYGKASDGDSLVKVSFQEVSNGYQLNITDNGPGMEEPQPDQLSSFGLKLIYALTDQLYGTVIFTNTNGSDWTITFDK